MTTDASRERTKATIQELASCYPRFSLSNATLAAYVKHLAKISADKLDRTCDRLAETSTFFPSIAEILTAANPPDERTNLSATYTAGDLERMIGQGLSDLVRDELLVSTTLTDGDRQRLAELLGDV